VLLGGRYPVVESGLTNARLGWWLALGAARDTCFGGDGFAGHGGGLGDLDFLRDDGARYSFGVHHNHR